MLVPNLIEKGIATMLSGPGGVHKSRLLVQWGLCLQAGLPIFGQGAVARATFVYLSYEDHPDEFLEHLGIPKDVEARYGNLKESEPPMIIVSRDGVVTTSPFWDQLRDYLRTIPGHKFVGIDSTYNAIMFQGNSKIDEGAVKRALKLLDRLCGETDSTIVYLFHPSRGAQGRDEASGWSTSFDNAPRGVISLNRVKDTDTFQLEVRKHNNGPTGYKLTLYWHDGILRPFGELSAEQQASRLYNTAIDIALLKATNGTGPLNRTASTDPYVVNKLEQECGRRPKHKEIVSMLEKAVEAGVLRYIKGKDKARAGYYPRETDPETLRTAGRDTADYAAIFAKRHPPAEPAAPSCRFVPAPGPWVSPSNALN